MRDEIHSIQEMAEEFKKSGNCVMAGDLQKWERKHEEEIYALMCERDEIQDKADALAEKIATIQELDIGEHTSCNCPWDNALNGVDVIRD